METKLLRPKKLSPGSTLGIFTPSVPGYCSNEELFLNGIKNLKHLGFEIKLGRLTAQRQSQGYRSGTPKERAQEFMELITNPEVDGLIATIGGANSSSMIPHLDFEKIRGARKPICGFSDVTSLHLAILRYSRLTTIYAPTVMCWFGDWPSGVAESSKWFLDAVFQRRPLAEKIQPPAQWSNHARRWNNDEWKTVPRLWQKNDGWRVLNPGRVQAPILALNFNTMMSAAGTPYWPDLQGKILLIEDMEASMSRTERHLRQLKMIGAFDQIAGLIIGKPEFFQQEDAPFSYDDLFREVIGPVGYPIISNFDCSHCVPMISVPQLCQAELTAGLDGKVAFKLGS